MLIDLDELVAQCPDPRSRQYIRESVQCYKAGAYRAAIVACWIAVAFDLIDKIREIAAAGDNAAQDLIGRFDRIRQSGDISGALAFEKELPTLARDNFEFISQVEYIDLVRLVEDRNRCAHPSQVSDTEVFQAQPELARMHIVNMIRCILSQPPVQGKAALDRLLVELKSKFFPSKITDVRIFLAAGPLKRPRESLVKNYLAILLKILLGAIPEIFEIKRRACDSFFSVREIHPEMWERITRELVNLTVSKLATDEAHADAVAFLSHGAGLPLWDYLNQSEKLRLSTFTENFPLDRITDLEEVLNSPDMPLFGPALLRIKASTRKELIEAGWWIIPDVVVSHIIGVYRFALNFSDANETGKSLREAARWSNTPGVHLAAIIEAGTKNDQVRGSNQFHALIDAFAAKAEIVRDDLIKMITEAGLPSDHWVQSS